METYSTYTFYTDTFGGDLPEEIYNQQAVSAKVEIDNLTSVTLLRPRNQWPNSYLGVSAI